jgi:prolipoprotein diacylglyceryl transferase
MTHALSFVWNPSEGIDLGFFLLRYYSLTWVIAFGLGWIIMKKIYDREGETTEKLDKLFIYTVVATMIGARLGHVIFYQPELFKEDPVNVFLPFRLNPRFEFTGFAGLASHGAAIAIILTMIYYSKKIIHRPILWMLDRVVIPVTSGGIFIRLGNFVNSEILGDVTSADTPTAIKFIRGEETLGKREVLKITGEQDYNKAYDLIQHDPKYTDVLNSIPYRHPAQLYEAFC